MRFRKLAAALASVASASLAAVAAADPRADYESVRKLYEIQTPPGVERGTDAHMEWQVQRARTLRESGLAFMGAYPTHPLRWDVLVLLQYSGRLEIVVRPDGTKSTVQPALEAGRWRHEYLGRLEDLLEASDARPPARHEALMQLIDHYCLEIRRALIDNPRRGLVPSLLEWVREFHALDPRSSRLAYLYIRVARMLNALEPERCRAFLDEKYALHAAGNSDTDVNVRRNVENFRRLIRNQEAPADELWSDLRRIDPAVDPARYRGKVVLVAHLAVDWTSRTRELEDLHRKYVEAGLEIIQVAYENRGQEVVWDGIRRTTRPAPLVQRERAAMESFVAEKKWPWPVLWEVASFDQKLSRVWALNSVPAYLIIGRDGRLAREIPGEMSLDVRLARELGLSGRDRTDRDGVPPP